MSGSDIQLGKNLRSMFLIKESITQFNCGSFGVVPKTVFQKRLLHLSRIEELPDYHLKISLNSKLIKIMKRLSSKVGCSCRNLVLIENVMQGINIVLNQFRLAEKDLVVNTSLAYKAVRNVLETIKHEKKAKIKELRIELGQSNSQIIETCHRFLKLLKSDNKSYSKKLLILEAISSTPAIILPYIEIANLFKQEGFIVILDGAHCFGQVTINFENCGADFFISNLYKWGFTFRPSAFLCIKSPNVYNDIRPLNVTFDYNHKDLKNRFLWPGTIDFSVFLSIEESLDFIERIGEDRILNHNYNLCIQGSEKVAETLGNILYFVRNNNQVGFMSNIKLPHTPKVEDNINFGAHFEQRFLREYKTQIKLFDYNNSWYVRLSAQIYLDMQDYEKLGRNLRKELFASKI